MQLIKKSIFIEYCNKRRIYYLQLYRTKFWKIFFFVQSNNFLHCKILIVVRSARFFADDSAGSEMSLKKPPKGIYNEGYKYCFPFI
jgi:hypothetical protein